jgi:hypothetical protein
MGEYKLVRFENLSESSFWNSNNSGQIPQIAKYRKYYFNPITGYGFSSTDLNYRLYKRDLSIELFCCTYEKLYWEKQVSILAFIVNESEYNSISKFLNTMTKKLSRKQIEKLGFVWVRDCGDKEGEPHFHLLLASTRINRAVYNELFSKKHNTKYQLEFMKTKNGLKSYLLKKELFGSKGKRAYGKSRKFKLPN